MGNSGVFNSLLVVLETQGRYLAQRRALAWTHINGPADIPKRLGHSPGVGSQRCAPQQPGKGSSRQNNMLCSANAIPSAAPFRRASHRPGRRTGMGMAVGAGADKAWPFPCGGKAAARAVPTPWGSPLMEGTLTPSPPADAAGAAWQSVHLLGCMGAGWDPCCPSVVSPSSGVTQTSQGWGESALTDHLPAPWPRTGIFQGFFSVPLRTPVPAGSQGLGISRPVSRAAWLHFGNSFGSTLHTSLAARTHLARAPRGLGKRWKKLSKLREGWDFGAANIFKSCCESRQRWFCL